MLTLNDLVARLTAMRDLNPDLGDLPIGIASTRTDHLQLLDARAQILPCTLCDDSNVLDRGPLPGGVALFWDEDAAIEIDEYAEDGLGLVLNSCDD